MYYKDFLTEKNNFNFDSWRLDKISTDYKIYFDERHIHIITSDKDLYNALWLRLSQSDNYDLWWNNYDYSGFYAKCFTLKNNIDNSISISLTKK